MRVDDLMIGAVLLLAAPGTSSSKGISSCGAEPASQVLAVPVRQRTFRAGPPPYSRFALFAARTAIEKQRSSIQPDRRFSMFNRNLLAAIVLAAVSSTALALDADHPAMDRDAKMSSEKGLA